MNKKYINDLENTIKQMLKHLKNLSFAVIVKSISGFSVLPFKQDKDIVSLLEKSFDQAAIEINKHGIKSTRPNEVGNYTEPFIKRTLNDVGFQAVTPIAQSGIRKSSGYPDIELLYKGQYFYLEVKTYNIKNINTTQRAFYFSPSENFKITKDAPHLMISYQIQKADDGLYYAKHWCLYSLENLIVDLKHEFNQSNRKLYGAESNLNLILEKSIEPE